MMCVFISLAPQLFLHCALGSGAWERGYTLCIGQWSLGMRLHIVHWAVEPGNEATHCALGSGAWERGYTFNSLMLNGC